MQTKLSRLGWLLACALWMTACAQAAPAPPPTSTPRPPAGELTPFAPTPRMSLTASPPLESSGQVPASTPAPLPTITPTPRTHTVKAGEDMFGIALRYRVTVEELIAANPQVNPRAMAVGTVLVIPGSAQSAPGAQPTQNPSPTALPVTLQGPDCWPAGDGGMWCFVLVENRLESAVENIFVRFRVAGPGEGGLWERENAGLLNLLPPGQRMPVSLYIPDGAPGSTRVLAELAAAFPLPPDDTRYLEPRLSGVQVQNSPDGSSATLRGRIGAEADAQTAWVAAAALDAQGRVVGVRRWDNPAPLSAAAGQDFSLTVFSLGGPVASLVYLAEIRR